MYNIIWKQMKKVTRKFCSFWVYIIHLFIYFAVEPVIYYWITIKAILILLLCSPAISSYLFFLFKLYINLSIKKIALHTSLLSYHFTLSTKLLYTLTIGEIKRATNSDTHVNYTHTHTYTATTTHLVGHHYHHHHPRTIDKEPSQDCVLWLSRASTTIRAGCFTQPITILLMKIGWYKKHHSSRSMYIQ